MTNARSHVPDRDSPQYKAAQDGLDMIHSQLLKMGRLKRELVSARPLKEPGEYSMTLIGDLLNRKRKNIGAIRVFIDVPVNGKDIQFDVQWTRHAFGFWYTKKFTLKDVVDDTEDVDPDKLMHELRPVTWTADGSVPLRSMNRNFKKVKKNRVRDKVVTAGLRRS
jgi:hypothetical protein